MIDDRDTVAIFVRLDTAVAALIEASRIARDLGDPNLKGAVVAALAAGAKALEAARDACGLTGIQVTTASGLASQEPTTS